MFFAAYAVCFAYDETFDHAGITAQRKHRATGRLENELDIGIACFVMQTYKLAYYMYLLGAFICLRCLHSYLPH